MKKGFLKILAIFLAVSCLISNMYVVPVAAAKKEDVLKKNALKAGGGVQVENVDDGVRIVFGREAQGWGRVQTQQLYDTKGEGTTIEISDIASADPDYSVVVMLGNELGRYYDGCGYMIVYGKSGYLSLVAMDGEHVDPNKATVLISEIREELGDSLSINIKLQGTKYVITVNKKAYTVTAEHMADMETGYVTFGVMGDGNIKSLNYSKSFANGATSYTVNKITNQMQGAGFEPIGTPVTDSGVGMNASTHLELYESELGIQVAYPNEAEGWERVYFTSGFPLDESGLHIGLEKIYSANPNYSMAIKLGNDGTWYDGVGIMIIYGKSGHFSIIGSDGVTDNPNKAVVYASEKREELGEKLSIDIKPHGNNFEITVNNKAYIVPTEYIANPSSLQFAFGVMGDGPVSTFNYVRDFKKAAVSFVISKETYTIEPESTRNLKAFADDISFMTGYEDGTFKPTQDITRGEAIVAMANLLVDADDIEGIYTSDFTDLKKKDKNYSYYAYMERCDFLPDFGEEFKPNQAITRGELVDLIADQKDVSEGLSIADISTEDDLYGKICYAVEKGMFQLDGNRNFRSNDTVTRAEAAKAFCIYLGKTTLTGEKKANFSDVKDSTEHASYIALATNANDIYKESYTITADGKETIQDCINKAIELSKTKEGIITIELEDDVYRLTEPVTIDGSAYGEYDVVIEIKNAKDTSPVISSNTDLDASKFKKVDGKEYYSYQLPETAKVDGIWPQFRDLYLNGEKLQLAQSGDYEFAKTFKDPVKADTGQVIAHTNWIYVDNEIFADIDNDTVSTLELCFNLEWTNKKYLVTQLHGVEEGSGLMQLSVSDECWHSYINYVGNKTDMTGWPYWFSNHIALLDEPGEFYYDATNGIIYFYPYADTDMKGSVVSYPHLEKLFDMKDAANITFEGITFTGTTSNFATEHGFNGGLGNTHGWNDSTEDGFGEDRFFKEGEENPFEGMNSEYIHCGAIYGDYSSRITVRNCTFDGLGTYGIFLNGGNHDITLQGNSFTDLGMSAAVFGRQRPLWSFENGQSNLIIDNNYIYNIGTDYQGSPGMLVNRVKNIAVTHNTVIHTPYSGIMIGWMQSPSTYVTVHNAEVAYNRFEDNLYSLNDGSGLYMCGANSLTNDAAVYNRVHDNYVKSTGYTLTYNGIYLDMNASNYSVYHNVIEGFDSAHGPIFNQDHAEAQYTYNMYLWENFSTVRSITTTAMPERNVVLTDNQQFPTAAELPKEAHNIIEATGQHEEYASSIPVKDTVIEMDVKEPHITVLRQGVSDKDSVTFTITNNSSETASYTVVHANKEEDSPKLVLSKDSLKLKAGETGTIEVAFRGGEVSKKGELLNLAVVKDNGWKMLYRRAIEVDVSFAYAEASAGILPIIAGSVVIIIAGVAVTVIVLKKKKAKMKA